MPKIFLSPSTQQYNQYITGGTEEQYMNLLADAMIPYLNASGIRYIRNNPNENVVAAVALANSGSYDLYLSLHSNASPEGSEGKLQGPDIYYYPTSVKGMKAAKIIEDNLKLIYPTPELVNILPSTKLYELRRSKFPAVLVEVAYHDNEDDANWITENIKKIAKNLSMSVAQYLGVPFVEPSSVNKGTIRLNSGALNVRDAPNTNAKIIGKLYNGDKVLILKTLAGWYNINFNGTTGYVLSDYVVEN